MRYIHQKMKIAVHSGRFRNFPEKHFSFYLRYASLVFRALKRSSFQLFLHWMLKKENIEQQAVRDVNVQLFPFRKENRHGLAGSCNVSKGNIRIYPKPHKFYRKLVQRFGKDKFLFYAKNRARATLIHELLHLKYADDEVKVRVLTKEYFKLFAQSRLQEKSEMRDILKIIFKPKIIENEVRALVALNQEPIQLSIPATIGACVNQASNVASGEADGSTDDVSTAHTWQRGQKYT